MWTQWGANVSWTWLYFTARHWTWSKHLSGSFNCSTGVTSWRWSKLWKAAVILAPVQQHQYWRGLWQQLQLHLQSTFIRRVLGDLPTVSICFHQIQYGHFFLKLYIFSDIHYISCFIVNNISCVIYHQTRSHEAPWRLSLSTLQRDTWHRRSPVKIKEAGVTRAANSIKAKLWAGTTYLSWGLVHSYMDNAIIIAAFLQDGLTNG